MSRISRRDLELGIRDAHAEIRGNAIVAISRTPLTVLSSAVLNPGFVNARSLVNYHVPIDFDHSDPPGFLKKVASRMRLPAAVVGLMTAAEVRNVSVKKSESPRVAALVTAGLSYPVSAGEATNPARHEGTINTIVVVDGWLSQEAFVGAVKTATEAKCIALRDLDVRSKFSKEVASGTTTDAIIIASTQRGRRWQYAGTSTALGRAIASTTKSATEEAIGNQEGLTRDRHVLRRLEERGITLEKLVETGMKLFVGASASRRKTASVLRGGLLNALSDLNIAALMLAAMRLEDEGERGAIPNLSAREFNEDPVRLVADEAIGMAIANYISGTLGVHNFLYYDREKPGLMKRLGPFMDDAVGGLVSGVMSKILRERG